MTRTSQQLILWLPRILGVAVGVFIGLFALDAFSGGKPVLQALGDFAIHLIPTAVVFGVVAIAWKYPWVGAVVFAGLGVLYAMSVRRLDWIALISGPLFLVGLLYFFSFLSGTRASPGRA